MSPLSNHPVRPDKPWRSQAAMNEPRDRRLYEIERALKFDPNHAYRRELVREFLDLTDTEETR